MISEEKRKSFSFPAEALKSVIFTKVFVIKLLLDIISRVPLAVGVARRPINAHRLANGPKRISFKLVECYFFHGFIDAIAVERESVGLFFFSLNSYRGEWT